MPRFLNAIFVLGLVAGVFTLGAAQLTHAAGRTPSVGSPAPGASGPAGSICTPGWAIIPSPNVGGVYNSLNAIAGAAGTDLWAAGNAGNATLMEHWNGSSWSIVTSPSGGTGANFIYDMAAVSSTDIWAVGSYLSGTTTLPLVEHWDGSAWSLIATPSPGAGDAALFGIAARAANDIWIVGYARGTSSVAHTLTEHWDGTGWTVVSSPDPASGLVQLTAARAFSSNDVWAAGAYYVGLNQYTLIEHWNGITWAIVSSPNASAPTGGNSLNGIAANSPTDIWSVGGYNTGVYLDKTLVEHWNGTAWTIVPSPNSPNPTHNFTHLWRAASLGVGNTWAVGFSAPDGQPQNRQPLAEYWNGSVWQVSPVPVPAGATDSAFWHVGFADPTQLWAVGQSKGSGLVQTLIERNDFACPTYTPTSTMTSTPTNTATSSATAGSTTTATPSATGTANATTTGTTISTGTPTATSISSATGTASVTATQTQIPTVTPTATVTLTPPAATSSPTTTATAIPTGTATVTTTPCTRSFSDVYPSDYFYTPVHYLVCHGVVSGYSDGTYRPYNNTTRAQMVKIVVLGFALPMNTPPPGTYTYADVPPGDTFFSYVEAATQRLSPIITGYPCGGPGEPCDGQSRPYFRPGLPVTRGQLAKLVVLAADWPLINPTSRTFEDVQPDTTFYTAIETSVCHGIINGYACGGSGEPCGQPARPYYRPADNAFRGQIAKIVYGAITTTATCAVSTP